MSSKRNRGTRRQFLKVMGASALLGARKIALASKASAGRAARDAARAMGLGDIGTSEGGRGAGSETTTASAGQRFDHEEARPK